ncbi:MAG TPA: hypothetical protein VFO29_06950 [Candidatus Rubrimentiphilum sp.]|nr:hypothetical protein [Candidatus Rubrimentiphilum sp.]
MRYVFAITAAAFALCTCAMSAEARCGRGSYKTFLHGFESARDVMRRKPQTAYNAFIALRAQAQKCGSREDRADVRYKLLLFETGLSAYIGAADAQRGNVATGRATAEAAMTQALAIERAHRSNVAELRLADELVAQIKTPLQIIDELQASPSPQP